ncbi:MAG: hypothetical protein AAGB93_21015 [Planctomycetota bacterium]
MSQRPTPPDAAHSPYAALISAQRRAARLTRTELAERLGVPTHIVVLWEDPRYEGVDLTILRRVANATSSELEIAFRPPSRPAPTRPGSDLPAWKSLLEAS